MSKPIGEVVLPDIKKLKSGKVREIFDLGETYLIVATDRISAFDYILPTLIPQKGIILNKLSVFWFKATQGIIENHFITDRIEEYPAELAKYREILEGRSMLVKKTAPIDVECVVRGYIAGSGWRDYQKTGMIGGLKIDNLKQGDKLPSPLFTPATKSHTGHDENITFEKMKELIPTEDAEFIKQKSIELYNFAHDYAREHNIIIADTKFEFGRINEKIILIDEIFTPDSSRFWDPALYKPGGSQASFDKQFVRDYLSGTDWDKNSPPPELPPDIVEKTVARYQEALSRLVDTEK
ncbi:MAG TPA: phosphoribosylaminoimidazolesuccinocarboxamide synthase [candidate division WOR-3 bacterium]|uniref:Phosphoribosylaminoimidazole-succinocarboxamide synthase n=1 Tax=candidate division WOR-3 bacterium TaxID=2052148 RepID=A0A9C9ELP2_UNCW3|nr:phosphoribosylaminoimidazolesuccinocarboxamide synthase [candidate division WOR-3 bacterium]